MAKNNPKKPGLLRSMLIALRAVPPLQRTLVMTGVFVSSIFELFGFATIIPLLSVMSPEAEMHMGGRRGVIRDTLEHGYNALGLPMNMVTLLLTILMFMTIKAVISIGVKEVFDWAGQVAVPLSLVSLPPQRSLSSLKRSLETSSGG